MKGKIIVEKNGQMSDVMKAVKEIERGEKGSHNRPHEGKACVFCVKEEEGQYKL